IPLPRSQRSTVSPWLAIPTASTPAPAASSAPRPAATIDSSSSWGSCSTAPPGPGRGLTAALLSPSTSPPSATTSALVDDVPWSMARTFIRANLHPPRQAGPELTVKRTVRRRMIGRDAPPGHQARVRTHFPARRVRRPDLRRELRGPGGGAGAGRVGRTHADRRPLRGGRAGDLCLRDPHRLDVRPGP